MPIEKGELTPGSCQKETAENDSVMPPRSSRPGNHGFTWWELLIVITGFILMGYMFMASGNRPGERARRVNCMSNQNSMWKCASQWGIDFGKNRMPPRPSFPETNLACAFAIDDMGFTPEIFICPGAIQKNKKSWNITPATNLNAVRARNCNYAYFGGRNLEAGALVLISDKNGSNNRPSEIAWGGNHDGKGGNIIRVAGQASWVTTPGKNIDAQYCITNADIVDAFETSGTVFAY